MKVKSTYKLKGNDLEVDHMQDGEIKEKIPFHLDVVQSDADQDHSTRIELSISREGPAQTVSNVCSGVHDSGRHFDYDDTKG